jgi:hypothetical protein
MYTFRVVSFLQCLKNYLVTILGFHYGIVHESDGGGGGIQPQMY